MIRIEGKVSVETKGGESVTTEYSAGAPQPAFQL